MSWRRLVPIAVTCECGRYFETPEANAGRRARCPTCGREFTLPTLDAKPEVLYLPDEPGPTRTSGEAVASLVFGLFFMFACLTGLPAILFGCKALGDIRRSGGRLKGR